MKFSENWLRELVDIPVDGAALVRKLTMSGLEVEEAVVLGAGLDGIVVGEIVSAERHPDADKLQVCRVDIGRGEPLQIVCGAPNARVGLKAPLATIGTTVGALTIKAAKLRGVESSGMLCSARELGLDADAGGLLELSADAVPGQALAAHLGLPDTMIELGLTPNRPDCLGLRGLAREVAAEFGTKTHLPAEELVPATHDGVLAVRLDAPRDCPLYCGRLLRGLDSNASSPAWLVERLRRSGLRPISALVDVTNYVMIETGQPLHAFDAGRVEGSIVVRRAAAGERLALLDERVVELADDVLVIADERKALALAGIMGGFESRVTTTTTDVFLEAAHFAPAAIGGRARRLGLHTDASHRFERGVDADLPRLAIERATALLLAIAGGSAGRVVEAVAAQYIPQRAPVRLRRARLERILGVSIDDAEVMRILAAIGAGAAATEQGWAITPPAARFDLAIEEDLIEEVARLHGYDNIPSRAPRGEISPPPVPEGRVAIAAMRDQLVARDYAEAITYAFVGGDLLETWGLTDGGIALANPISAELAVMRTSLLPGLVAALAANLARQQERVRLFEIGRRYIAGDPSPVETRRIAGVATGPAVATQWSEPARALDFFDIKGDVESLLALAGAASDDVAFRAGGPAWLHPGRSATVLRGEVVLGHVGALAPRLQKALDLGVDVYAFDLDVDGLAARTLPVAAALSRFPSVRRDLSFTLPATVAWAEVEEALRAAVGPLLVDVFVFDQYLGPNLGEGVKSLATGLILQDGSRTLTDQDADRCVALAVAALQTGYKAKLRG
ncbi:MAG: phenylalanine--tRNA ligase subunit beta [Xanthomonadales bacterium]|nr:phenylalanine--tRNA ligase subunit beta [Xanthomonadales bacterium]